MLRCVHVPSTRCVTSAEVCAHHAFAWYNTSAPASHGFRNRTGSRTHLHLPHCAPLCPNNAPLHTLPSTAQEPWFSSLTPEALEFFDKRGIPKEVLKQNRVYCVRRPDTHTDYIAFPFYKDGTIVHIKFRAINKKMFFSVSCLTRSVSCHRRYWDVFAT